MIDIETLGTAPGSVILSIGAVEFGKDRILDSFYQRVDPDSCVSLGMTIDAHTVMWWLQQSDAARDEITQPGMHISKALTRFSHWISDPDAEIWGNGAAFDNVLLADAYRRAGLPCPWKYQNDRCYRTLRALYPEIPMEPSGTAHHALDDAVNQARHLMKILVEVMFPRLCISQTSTE